MSDDNVAEDYIHFRHNRIRRFKVGKYEFNDHMITVKAEDLDDFMKTVEGLAPIDKNAIEQVLNIRNTRSISELRKARSIRGVQGTNKIVDKTGDSSAPSVEDDAEQKSTDSSGDGSGESTPAQKPATSLLQRAAQQANQSS